jgi:hypothetical protein
MSDGEITKLEARVKNLEGQVAFLLRVNGLDLSALRNAPDGDLLKIYRDSIQILGLQTKDLAPEACVQWAELFCQISEFELVRLQQLVDYDHTWEPFYTLCVRMMTATRHAKGFAKNGELHHLYAFLEKGRKNLRNSAVIMVQKYPQSIPQSVKVLLKDELALT